MSDLYRLVDYTDVFGDGSEDAPYEVNNLSRTDIEVIVDEKDEDKDIIQKLIDVRFLTEEAIGKVELVDLGEFIEIEAEEDGFPLGRLELVIQEENHER